MRFGLFGSAAARRGGGEFDSAEGFRDFIEYNIEAEALGFHGTFVVEHHFTGFGQVSATLNLLTWFSAPMPDADARFEECLTVLLKSWTSEQRFSHRGKYWSFNDIIVEPPSAQK